MTPTMTREQVAEELQISPRQVDELRRAGKLRYIDVSAGEGKAPTPRYLPEHLEEFKREATRP